MSDTDRSRHSGFGTAPRSSAWPGPPAAARLRIAVRRLLEAVAPGNAATQEIQRQEQRAQRQVLVDVRALVVAQAHAIAAAMRPAGVGERGFSRANAPVCRITLPSVSAPPGPKRHAWNTSAPSAKLRARAAGDARPGPRPVPPACSAIVQSAAERPARAAVRCVAALFAMPWSSVANRARHARRASAELNRYRSAAMRAQCRCRATTNDERPAQTTPTWEMELLVSGATIFGLLQLPTLLDRAYFRVQQPAAGCLSRKSC